MAVRQGTGTQVATAQQTVVASTGPMIASFDPDAFETYGLVDKLTGTIVESLYGPYDWNGKADRSKGGYAFGLFVVIRPDPGESTQDDQLVFLQGGYLSAWIPSMDGINPAGGLSLQDWKDLGAGKSADGQLANLPRDPADETDPGNPSAGKKLYLQFGGIHAIPTGGTGHKNLDKRYNLKDFLAAMFACTGFPKERAMTAGVSVNGQPPLGTRFMVGAHGRFDRIPDPTYREPTNPDPNKRKGDGKFLCMTEFYGFVDGVTSQPASVQTAAPAQAAAPAQTQAATPATTVHSATPVAATADDLDSEINAAIMEILIANGGVYHKAELTKEVPKKFQADRIKYTQVMGKMIKPAFFVDSPVFMLDEATGMVSVA